MVTRKKKPFPKPWTSKRCPDCLNPVKGTDSRSSWDYEGSRFWFHSHCFDALYGVHGRTAWKVKEAILNFLSAGYKSEIAPPAPGPRIHSPQAHVKAFEPSKSLQVQRIETIVEVLTTSDRPLSYKELSIEAQIPYTTIYWLIWECLEGSAGCVGEPIFELAKEPGMRGVFQIQLFTRKER